MIRINLLPFRTARKKQNVQRQLAYAFLGFIVILAGLIFINIWLGSKIDSLSNQIAATKKQVEKYRRDAQEVDQIKKQLATLKRKTQVINDLENNRQWPVRLMDTMTQVVVEKRMWLTRFSVKNNGVGLDGIAIDNILFKCFADFRRFVTLHGQHAFRSELHQHSANITGQKRVIAIGINKY